jgi:hypothetical protein
MSANGYKERCRISNSTWLVSTMITAFRRTTSANVPLWARICVESVRRNTLRKTIALITTWNLSQVSEKKLLSKFIKENKITEQSREGLKILLRHERISLTKSSIRSASIYRKLITNFRNKLMSGNATHSTQSPLSVALYIRSKWAKLRVRKSKYTLTQL